jgi:hypothetical protein
VLTCAWSAKAKYFWNNTSVRGARACRAFVDAWRPLRHSVVSADDHGGPSIAYLGLPAGHLNVLRLLEHQRSLRTGGASTVTPITASWSDLRAGRLPEADIVLLGAERVALRALPKDSAMILPFRMHMVVDTSCDLATVRTKMSRRERRSFTSSRRDHDWKLAEDTTTEAFESFYRDMYLPTVQRRHSEGARIESYDAALHCILPNGRLFFLYQHGTRVAGMLCLRSANDRVLTTRLLGVADGDEAHYASGAAKALYHLLIEQAVDEPVDQLDLFGTEPFMAKGIFQFKRKLGATVVLPDNHFATKVLYMVVNHSSEAVRQFLLDNPVVRLGDDNHLEPVVFRGKPHEANGHIGVTVCGLPDPVEVDLDAFLGARENHQVR